MHSKQPIFEMLRAVAVLMVVLGHFSTTTADFPFYLKAVVNSIAGYGIPLFFILSGYLLSASLSNALMDYPLLTAIRIYYLKRILRIYPAYLVSLIILALYEGSGWLDFWVHFFNLHNFYDNFHRSINAVYWSLAVEFQWYLVSPLLILLQLRPRFIALGTLLTLLLISLMARLSVLDAYLADSISYMQFVRLAFDQLYIHLFNFSIGILIFKFRHYRLNAANLIGMLMLIVLVSFSYLDKLGLIDSFFIQSGHSLRFKVYSYYLLLLCLGILVHSLLGIRLKRKRLYQSMFLVSSISYSLYIYHFPILLFVKKLHFGWPLALLIYLTSSILLATLSYMCVEKIFLGYSSNLARYEGNGFVVRFFRKPFKRHKTIA